MAYALGIDLGTTYTAAAIRRQSAGRWADAEVVELDTRSTVVPSVLFLAQDGSVEVGEAAQRCALTDPARVACEFTRRIGDNTPMIVDGTPYSADELLARLVRWVADRVARQEGGPAGPIAVTHPVCWGPRKTALLGSALSAAGLTRVMFLTEPQAAAINYALAERVERGSTIAVYDLGGGTFDAAVVRQTRRGGFELLGTPAGIERLGGIDFDDAVFAHVRAGLGDASNALDTSNPDVITSVFRLRRECVRAKEALSTDTEVTIPVSLPDFQTRIQLRRTEFEDRIRSAIENTVDVLRSAVDSAGVRSDDLSTVLLVGGSSRIPLVAQLVSEGLRRPVTVHPDPKLTIALGAVAALSPPRVVLKKSATVPMRPVTVPQLPVTAPELPVPTLLPRTLTSDPPSSSPPAPVERWTDPDAERDRGGVRPMLVLSAASLLLTAGLVGFVMSQQVESTSGPPESSVVLPTSVAPTEPLQRMLTTNPAPEAKPSRRQPLPPARLTRDNTKRTTTESATGEPTTTAEPTARQPTAAEPTTTAELTSGAETTTRTEPTTRPESSTAQPIRAETTTAEPA